MKKHPRSTWREVSHIFIPPISSAEIDERLTPVLRAMEQRGIMLDLKKMKQLDVEAEKKIATIAKSITDLAGEAVNLGSPRQLSELLFTKLHLPTEGIRKTKSSYSTDAEQLQKLSKEFPIASLLLEYRELSKLLSTYLLPLPKLVDDQGRLHTTYGQETATGRLNSRNPNLQNIPIRGEWGTKIRDAFIASKGKRLVAVDYSQIELRLAACMSGDPVMVTAFEGGEDIHRRTAAELLQKDIHEVTKDERRFAKTVNFGILYGMGPHGLSTALDISYQEAAAYIDTYFVVHKGLKSYIDQAIVSARKTGRVETVFGRVREVPELASPIESVRRSGERMAVNMPIQGTAAEILKLAMIELEPRLLKKKAAMLLTVHDELIVECETNEAPLIAREVRSVMESVVGLCVPLIAEAGVGKSWATVKAIS